MAPVQRPARPKRLSSRETTARHLWLAGLGLAARGAAGANQARARLQSTPQRVRDALQLARATWALRAATLLRPKQEAGNRAGAETSARPELPPPPRRRGRAVRGGPRRGA